MSIPGLTHTRIRMEHHAIDERRTFEIERNGTPFDRDLAAECLTEAIATVFRDPLMVAEKVVEMLKKRVENSPIPTPAIMPTPAKKPKRWEAMGS